MKLDSSLDQLQQFINIEIWCFAYLHIIGLSVWLSFTQKYKHQPAYYGSSDNGDIECG